MDPNSLVQRTEAGIAYEKAVAKLRARQNSSAADDVALVKAAKEDLYRAKSLGVTEVYTSKTIQSLSVQYANDEYIGDRLMPIINAGNQPTGKYFIYDKRSRLAVPDDMMSDRGMANEIDDARSTDSFSTTDYGLSNSISKKVVDAADAPLDEMIDLTEAINEAMSLKREMRQAAILCSTTYLTNYTAISAGLRWDSSGGGNPVKDIQLALKSLWTGRGPSDKIAYCSRDVWDVLARHPAILDLFKYNGSSPGLATPKMLAGWFGLADILVGDARKDTANAGQTASYSRVWSDVFGVIRVAKRPSIRNASFGYTFRLNGTTKASQWFDQRMGLDGRWFAKVATADAYKVVAADTGYLLTTPIG